MPEANYLFSVSWGYIKVCPGVELEYLGSSVCVCVCLLLRCCLGKGMLLTSNVSYF